MEINPLIFVVDDDKFAHHLLKAILKKFSFRNIEHFFSGEDCLENIEKSPDIILLDFEMDGINGLETLKQIKNRFPDTKVLMISGQQNINVAVKAIKSGAEDYFIKDSTLPLKLKEYFGVSSERIAV